MAAPQALKTGSGAFDLDFMLDTDTFTQVEDAERIFAKIRRFGDRVLAGLPDRRAYIRQINAAPRGGRA